eukprot:1308715-Prymnesium_polylepis.1
MWCDVVLGSWRTWRKAVLCPLSGAVRREKLRSHTLSDCECSDLSAESAVGWLRLRWKRSSLANGGLGSGKLSIQRRAGGPAR